jgi:hypothetical protein
MQRIRDPIHYGDYIYRGNLLRCVCTQWRCMICVYGFGGRYDRGDAQDVEPMIYLPLKKFQKIEGATL